MSSKRVREILAAVLNGHSDDAGDGALPARLCAACTAALPVSGVGLALMTGAGHGGALAATDEPAAVMEDLQFSLGEGPCVDASRGRRPVLLPDLAGTGVARWPGFGPAALAAGVGAIFAFPLQVGAIRLGVLDLYRDVPGPLTDADLGEALAFADAATTILLHLQAVTGPGVSLHPQLAEPAADRPEVHQATGMIAVQSRVGLTEALLLLRANAYAADRPLLEVARDVVSRRLRFDPEDDHHE